MAALAGCLVVGGVPATSQAAPSKTLHTGFMESAYGGTERATWMERSRDVGATRARLNLHWDEVAPTAPADGAATDPGWSGYRFATFDLQVRAAVAAGLTPYINVSKAPLWAQGSGRPSDVGRGSWKPDAAAFERFMGAVAGRYSGDFADPATGRLPRVTTFQLWNEPNLDTYLAPQWQNGKPYAPRRFRQLVNAGYAGVKDVQPRARIVTAGLAPFGDYRTTSGRRMPPVTFLRSALCLNSKLKRSCKARTRFDVLAHHPYAVRKPSSGALNRHDVTIPDLGRLTKVTRAARRARTISKTPRLWITEVSYDSRGPDPNGVPTSTLSRWIPELLWRLWDQDAETVIWYLVRDAEPKPSFAASYQSGMYFNDGRKKASAQSFRFPLLVTSRTKRTLRVWLRSPQAGQARIQVRRGSTWRTVKRVAVETSGVRTVSVPRSGVRGVRAVVAGEKSYAWSTR